MTDATWLADFYRDLHQHPELSLQEHRTARRVAEGLRPLGIEVTEQVGGTGVVGLLRNGDGPVVTRDLVRNAVERIIGSEAAASAAPRPPDLTWMASAPLLVSDPAATEVTVAAFAKHFGERRLMPMPLVTASEDVGVFGEAAGIPTVFWFWGGLDTETVLAALRDGKLDSLPGNHSPQFAPLIEPTLSTGVQALVVAALTQFATSAQ